MVDDDSWVCGNCRSINSTRSPRCYSCRSPRALAVDIATVSSASRSTPIREDADRNEQANLASKAGAAWRPTDRLAWGVRLAIVLVTIASLARIGFDVWRLGQQPSAGLEDLLRIADPVAFVLLGAAWIASFAAWGAWLSRIVANIPALGGGWPGTTPGAAFLSAAIPGSNLVWGTAVMRDVLARLAPRGESRLGLLTAWWIATALAAFPWIGRIPGQTAILRLGYRLIAGSLAGIASAILGGPVLEEQMVEVLAGVLLVVAAALALSLVDQIEDLQEERRAELGLLPPAAAEGAPEAGSGVRG